MGVNKDHILNLYGLEETPDAVYEAMMRLEGRKRPLPGDEELVQSHIEMKCREIRKVKEVLGLNRPMPPSPNRLNDARAERDLVRENFLRGTIRSDDPERHTFDN